MALPKSNKDREFFNFKDNGDGTTSRYVCIVDGAAGATGISESALQAALQNALMGSVPSPNYDLYTKITTDADTVSFVFTCGGVRQFIIEFNNLTGDYTTSIVDVNNLTTEGGADGLLSETDDNLIQE